MATTVAQAGVDDAVCTCSEPTLHKFKKGVCSTCFLSISKHTVVTPSGVTTLEAPTQARDQATTPTSVSAGTPRNALTQRKGRHVGAAAAAAMAASATPTPVSPAASTGRRGSVRNLAKLFEAAKPTTTAAPKAAAISPPPLPVAAAKGTASRIPSAAASTASRGGGSGAGAGAGAGSGAGAGAGAGAETRTTPTSAAGIANMPSTSAGSAHWMTIRDNGGAGELRLTDDKRCEQALRSVGDEPLHMLSIVGSARQGKSTLINKLARRDVFRVTHGAQPCTAGVDLCLDMLPVTIVDEQERSDTNDGRVAFVDVEGQGDRSEEYDVTLALPIALLSQVVIFNIMGGVAKNEVLEKLAVFTTAAQRVVEPEHGDDGDTAMDHDDDDEGESEGIFGHLHIVYRDYSLESTADEVRAQIMGRERRTRAKDARRRNEIRDLLESQFASITVHLLPHPKLDAPGFDAGVQALRGAIAANIHGGSPKRFAGATVTGTTAAELLPRLVTAVNTEEEFDLQPMWVLVRERIAAKRAEAIAARLQDGCKEAVDTAAPSVAAAASDPGCRKWLTEGELVAMDATLRSWVEAEVAGCGMDDWVKQRMLVLLGTARDTAVDDYHKLNAQRKTAWVQESRRRAVREALQAAVVEDVGTCLSAATVRGWVHGAATFYACVVGELSADAQEEVPAAFDMDDDLWQLITNAVTEHVLPNVQDIIAEERERLSSEPEGRTNDADASELTGAVIAIVEGLAAARVAPGIISELEEALEVLVSDFYTFAEARVAHKVKRAATAMEAELQELAAWAGASAEQVANVTEIDVTAKQVATQLDELVPDLTDDYRSTVRAHSEGSPFHALLEAPRFSGCMRGVASGVFSSLEACQEAAKHVRASAQQRLDKWRALAAATAKRVAAERAAALEKERLEREHAAEMKRAKKEADRAAAAAARQRAREQEARDAELERVRAAERAAREDAEREAREKERLEREHAAEMKRVKEEADRAAAAAARQRVREQEARDAELKRARAAERAAKDAAKQAAREMEHLRAQQVRERTEQQRRRRRQDEERQQREERERVAREQQQAAARAFMAQVYYQDSPTVSSRHGYGDGSHSGMRFYKGGQFMPGGGRAPKGGTWA